MNEKYKVMLNGIAYTIGFMDTIPTVSYIDRYGYDFLLSGSAAMYEIWDMAQNSTQRKKAFLLDLHEELAATQCQLALADDWSFRYHQNSWYVWNNRNESTTHCLAADIGQVVLITTRKSESTYIYNDGALDKWQEICGEMDNAPIEEQMIGAVGFCINYLREMVSNTI